jgi:hypothetical protein
MVWRKRVSFTVLEEVKESITLPHYDDQRQQALGNTYYIDLGQAVEEQMKDYVSSSTAAMYQANRFHNFEHALHSHPARHHLSRIIAPAIDAMNATLHDCTYGIASDPLTQFLCVFSALIHDVDYSGVPNTQLIIEIPMLAAVYQNKSVAEPSSACRGIIYKMHRFQLYVQRYTTQKTSRKDSASSWSTL